ncbi:MAG: hypothetical protein VKP62_15635, partial [Candidatus Sericytochromatia bacterium]|nr:hypothetical protein [Candidatus Sericytochromatia bacterium]
MAEHSPAPGIGPLAQMRQRLESPRKNVRGTVTLCATCIRESFEDWKALKGFLHQRVYETATGQDDKVAFEPLGSGCMG